MKPFCCPGFSGSVFFVLRICVCWLLALLCLSHHAQASSLSPILLDDTSGSKFPKFIELLEDPEARLTLRDVMSPAMDGRFTASESIRFNFGYTRSAIWARFKVSSQTDRRWLIMLTDANRDVYYGVYAVPDNQAKTVELPQPLKQLALYPTQSYLMDFKAGETYTVYLYTRSLNSPLFCCVQLSPEDDLTAGVQLRQLFFGLALGACLALALYNLLLFFTFYEYSYINLFGLIIFLMLESGHGLFLALVEYESYLRVRYVFAIMAILFFLQMVRQIAVRKDIKQQALDRLADKFLMSLMTMAVILTAILPFLEFQQFYFTIFMGLTVFIIVAVVVRAAWLNRPMARTFLLALLFLAVLAVGPPAAAGFGVHLFPVEMCLAGLIEAVGLVLFLLALSLMQISRTRQLRDDRERAEAANQAKSHFLTTMTHELRTPMNAIVGIGALMKSTPLDREQKDYLEKLSASSQHLLALVNDILDFSEVEQTEIKLDVEVFNLHQVVTDIDKILSEQARKKGLTLSCHCHLPEDTYIKGDSTRLMQIIMNLCGNAIKFTGQGKVELLIEPLLTVAGEDNKTVLKFTVTDTGIGMSGGALKALFQPFTQVDKGTKRAYGGSGLGLFISKQLVSAMGGELEVTSKPEEGSHFFFTLSFETASAAEKRGVITPITGVERIAENMIEALSGKHALLVDDDEINCFVAERFLGKRDMVVSTVGDGQEALQLLEEQGSNVFDLIFMDISMPGMDGYETTRKIRSMGFTKTPIIALTAHGIIGERERCIAAGMNDFCTKPFALSEFERLLLKWVSR